jgi:hypothetical protein
MLDFLNAELVGKVLLIMMIVMGCLSGMSLALEKIKDLTESDLDNKIYAVVSKIAGALQKVVDFISANRAHK